MLQAGRISDSVEEGEEDVHDALPANGADLDFDVDDLQRLCADIDLHETRVDRLVELSESRDEADGTCGRCASVFNVKGREREKRRTLLDLAERIREGTTWDHATDTDDGTEALQERSIEAVRHLRREYY